MTAIRICPPVAEEASMNLLFSWQIRISIPNNGVRCPALALTVLVRSLMTIGPVLCVIITSLQVAYQ